MWHIFGASNERIAAAARSADWALIVLVGFFVGCGVLATASRANVRHIAAFARIFADDPLADYRTALAQAALKRPDFKRPLAAIDAQKTSVKVVTFRRPDALETKDRKREMWVAFADELRAACAGARDPVLRLQQVLGLPPVKAPANTVTEVEVKRDDLIRPCLSTTDVGASNCEFALPPDPAQNPDVTALKKDYNALRLMTKQMWESYRVGFAASHRAIGDYPDSGYPFTGMGWTYDWSPDKSNHFGVSEFVIKPEAEIKIVSETPPAKFCKAAN